MQRRLCLKGVKVRQSAHWTKQRIGMIVVVVVIQMIVVVVVVVVVFNDRCYR